MNSETSSENVLKTEIIIHAHSILSWRIMPIHINQTDTPRDIKERIHYMPCRINSNGEANVSKYFEPYITKNQEEGLKVSFRGRPLHGKVINLPHSYQGLILQETNEPACEESVRNFYVTHKFTSMNYWDWGQHPTENDAFIKALDWIDIAEVLHSNGKDE